MSVHVQLGHLVNILRFLLQFYRVLLPTLLRKTHQRRNVTYDVIDKMRRLSLSKCHQFIYERAIFHSINRETCNNIQIYKYGLGLSSIWKNIGRQRNIILTEDEGRGQYNIS